MQNGAIYYENLTTGKIGKLQTSIYTQSNPDISGFKVVWMNKDQLVRQYFSRNILTGAYSRLYQTSDTQVDPKISGNRVVWTQYHYLTSGALLLNIYTKNLSNGTVSKVYASSHNQSNPDISGTKVVWQHWDVGKTTRYVLMKDLITGIVTKVSTNLTA